MAAIFISHSSRDDATASDMRAWLTSQGHRSLFLDFDPELGIPAGRNWEQELYRQLRACRAVIVLCSQASMTSRWCFAEITQASALGKVLLPVRIDDCKIDGVLTSRQVIDLRKDRTEGFSRLRQGLLAAGVDPTELFDWDGSRSPYPGLLSFQGADAAVYFGRADEIGAGLDVLNRVHRLGMPRVVVVVGASGSGKSSLVRAGLVPRLRRDTERWLVPGPFRPRDEPIAELAVVWSHAFRALGETRSVGELTGLLRSATDETAMANPLSHMARELRRAAGSTDAKVLLIVDQLEELLIATSPEGSDVLRFLREGAEGSGGGLIVLATLRSDFLGAFQQHPALTDLDCELVPVGPMSIEHAAQVIEGPAAVAGLELEPGLVRAMLADTDTDDALPLLAFTLRELYDHFGADGVLQVGEYRELGGLHGALARVADELVESQNLTSEQENRLRRAFIGMVRLTEDDRWVRQVARWNELPALIHPVLEKFVAARLLVSAGDAGTRTVEVAHEALFRSWRRLAEWLQQDAEALRLHRDLDNAAAAWTASGRQPADLWRGGRLDRVAELIRGGDLHPSATSQAFIDAGLAARQAELDAQERSRRRRLRIAAVVTAGALLLAAIAGLFFVRANRESERATQQARRNAALALAAQAGEVTSRNPALGLALAAEAAQTTPRPLAQALSALVTARIAFAYQLGQPVGHPLESHTGWLSDVAFSPDGTRLATAGEDGTVRLWNPVTGQPVGQPLEGHADRVSAVTFSPRGTPLASAGVDGTVRLWDPATGQPVGQPLRAHEYGVVEAVAFSPDGTLLASAHSDGSAQLWDPATGQPIGQRLEVDPVALHGVAFSPDGQQIAFAGYGAIRLLNPATGQPVGQALQGHTTGVNAVAYKPDGTLLASAGDDGSVRFWDPATGQQVGQPLLGHSDGVNDVAFSPDGTLLATASADGTVGLWDAATGQQVGQSLQGHTNWVTGVAFSPDATLLASAGGDGTVRLWDPAPREPIVQSIEGHTDEVFGVAFSPDGDRLASASGDETVRLWDPATGEPLGQPLRGHTDRVIAVAFSPDGTLLASASDDMTVRLWNPATGQPVGQPLRGHTDAVLGVAFSPDGRLLASAGDDSVRVWEAATGRPVGQPLEGHSDSWGVAFSPDGQLLASASDASVRLSDPTTGQQVGQPLRGHTGKIFAVAFNPDGTLLASASEDGTVRLWDPTTGQPVGQPLQGHTGPVHGVAFSPDGAVLASVSGDARVRLWDPATGQPVGRPLIGHSGDVWAVAFSPDGALLASASSDRTVRVWNSLDIDRACVLVEPYVTVADLDDYRAPGEKAHGCRLRTTPAD